MREIKTCPDQGWQQMPIEELDRILQAELEKEHPNEEVVLPILHELEERERNRSVAITPEVLELTKKLSKYETSSKKQSIHNRKWLAAIAAVAAAVCIVVMAIPQTVGAESIFDVLFRWTSSVFEFIDPDKNEGPNVDSNFSTDHPGLQQLYDKVKELGITEAVIPTWLPEGFELWDLQVIPLSDSGNKVNAAFGRNGKNIVVAYRITPSIVTKYEKKDTSFEVYDYADVSHFILENDGKLSVKWTVNDVECSIVAEISKDDVYQIIKSIYRRSL